MQTSGTEALNDAFSAFLTPESAGGERDIERRIRVFTEVAVQFGAGLPLVELTDLLPTTGPGHPEQLRTYLAGRPDLADLVGLAAYPPSRGGGAEDDRIRRGAEYIARAEALLEGPLRWLQPSIRCIGVTGSVAYGAPTLDDDLDFFVITRAGALPWFLAGTYLMLRLRRLRKRDALGPTPCFNYVLDERRAPAEFAPGKGLLFAREALSARMLRGDDYYRAFLAQFPWLGVEIPRLYAARAARGGDARPQPASLLTRVAGALVFLPLATYLQCGGLIRNAQYRREHRESYLHRTLVAPGRVATLSRRFELLRAHYEPAEPAAPPSPDRLVHSRAGEGLPPPSNDRDLLWIRTRGEPAAPLRYWTEGSFFYLMAASTDRRWRVALLREGGCEATGRDGLVRSCAAVAVTDPSEAARARDGIRQKYGSDVWDRHFRPTDRVVRLDPTRPPMTPSLHERLRWEFDALAPSYTHAVESNSLNRYLKARTRTWLLSAFDGVDPLLEIGPGTGFETLPLLEAGHQIVAVDISRPMLDQLQERARAAGVAHRLSTRVAALSELGASLEGFAAGTFGGAYSTFGAFNLEAEVERCAAALERAIRPGGQLVFTSLNYPGATPAAWELLMGHPREALARMRRTIAGNASRNSLDLYLRNPGFWDRTLGPAFERLDVRPVSVLTPPFDAPRLVRFLSAPGRRRARALDAALSRHPMLAPLAEWVQLTYRRRPAEGPAPHEISETAPSGG